MRPKFYTFKGASATPFALSIDSEARERRTAALERERCKLTDILTYWQKFDARPGSYEHKVAQDMVSRYTGKIARVDAELEALGAAGKGVAA